MWSAFFSKCGEKKLPREIPLCLFQCGDVYSYICVSSNEAELTKNKLISDIIQNDRMLGKYKSFFPYYWSEMAEWILIIIDRSKSSIRVCYSNFSPVDTSRIESTQKQSKLIEKKKSDFSEKSFFSVWKSSCMEVFDSTTFPYPMRHNSSNGIWSLRGVCFRVWIFWLSNVRHRGGLVIYSQ